jgi:Predicted double-stranded RNA/RNA-DNA hybrid binding protein
MAKIKFYGVKVGRLPGVYKTWAECQKQVIGYQGALFKSFPTEAEAREYVAGTSPTVSNTTQIQAKNKPDGQHYDIYVDGSYDNNKKQYSWAFAVYDGSQVIHTSSGVGKDANGVAIRNVAGELEATIEAVKWAENQVVDTVTIHHDYVGISEWATGKWKTNNTITQNYAYFIRSYLHWVNFNKVAGHTGVEGNELADKLAGEALGRL